MGFSNLPPPPYLPLPACPPRPAFSSQRQPPGLTITALHRREEQGTSHLPPLAKLSYRVHREVPRRVCLAQHPDLQMAGTKEAGPSEVFVPI